jgi:hypothetical protein
MGAGGLVAMTLAHRFVSDKVDGPNTALLRPSDWGSTHTILPTHVFSGGATGDALVRDASAEGAGFRSTGWIDGRDYGMVNDGVTNNATPLANAMTAAVASQKVLFLIAGSYNVLTTVNLLDGLTIVSDGLAVITNTSETAGPTLTDNNVAVAVKLRGVRIYRATTTAPANCYALWIQNVASIVESDRTAWCETGDTPYTITPNDSNGSAILNYGTIAGLNGKGTTCYGLFNYGNARFCYAESTRNAAFVNRGQDAVASDCIAYGKGVLSLCGFWNGDGNTNTTTTHSTAQAINCIGYCDSHDDTSSAFSNEGVATGCIGVGYGTQGIFNRGGRAFGCQGYGKRSGNLTSHGFVNIGYAEDCTGESDGWWSGFYNVNAFSIYPNGVAVRCSGSVIIKNATGFNQTWVAGFLNDSAAKAIDCSGFLDVPDTIEAYALRTSGVVLGGRFHALGANAAIKVVAANVILENVWAVCENGTVCWIAADTCKVLGGCYRTNKAEATIGILFSNGVVAKLVDVSIFTNTVSGSACMKGLGGAGSPNLISYVGVKTNTSPVFVTQSAAATLDAQGNIINANIY